ncbi:sigma-54-dependent transcriptional regulator [Azoarcus olearius]|uniref:Hydrogenase transcriptional regulatory protein n=1 Tax=Azoarcus sp. (strain BH72) TaxID=418699 RepID=A1KC65_AZOSB|nr:sigma-54 dependent transcriptional regulator [Azoarcus olearius]ANQ86973.1 hydrogenase transcriptional regulatory protein [Azoarcus olearius]CAL96421.1 hydrogenase transcriptional regulatory protein [Azoarcus olearius]
MPPPLPPELPSILVVDDEIRSQEALRRTLEEDFEVFTASGADDAIAILEREWIQIVLCDQRMPGSSGVALLRQVRERWPEAVRIIISGYTDSEDIIAGINEAGIYQYLLKPWQPEQLLLALKSAAEMARLHAENQRLTLELRTAAPVLEKQVSHRRASVRQQFALDAVLRAPGSPMNAVCALVKKLAALDIPVLLTGESGTGKELLARALHYDSPRAGEAFVVENCGALPDQLLESELFGHKRGAFTGAFEDRVGLFKQADGGTMLLDEIGETSFAFQVKLLRALQEGEVRPVGAPRPIPVDARVIAATNRDLEAEVRAGRFREDLYYRLAALTIHVPPLRERTMDIPLIAQALVDETQAALGRRFEPLSAEVITCLQAWRWPGNVRELRNEVLRMIALADDERLSAAHLSPRVLRAGDAHEEPALSMLSGLDGDLKTRLEALEARIVKESLIRHRWNKTRAAKELGLSRVGLRSKLARYGLERD